MTLGSNVTIFTFLSHQMKGICVNFSDLFFIPQGTLLSQPIFGKICEMTFIQHTGVLKGIRIS